MIEKSVAAKANRQKASLCHKVDGIEGTHRRFFHPPVVTEAFKIMSAEKITGSLFHGRKIRIFPEIHVIGQKETITAVKNILYISGINMVFVCFVCSQQAGMKTVFFFFCFQNTDIFRKILVQVCADLTAGKGIRCSLCMEAGGLAQCVDTRIGSSGAGDFHRHSIEPAQYRFDLFLDRIGSISLFLPAVIAAAVVLNSKTVDCHGITSLK